MSYAVGLVPFSLTVQKAFNDTILKIKKAVTSPLGQQVIGFGLGLYVHKIYSPLTEKIVKALGVSRILPDPFRGFGLFSKLLLAPFICVLSPIVEEKQFRGDWQGRLKEQFESFYLKLGISTSKSNLFARVTSVFFTSVIFGLIHFTNAIFFWCNPTLFLPQVVAATIMGLVFGFAKELTGELDMPIGMHIGNNTFAWCR